MAANSVNERSSTWVTVTLRDKAGTLVGPDSVRYRIDCLTTGAEVLARTDLSAPGSSFEIHVGPDLNAIQNAANAQEFRRLTVEAYYGGAEEITAEFDYSVINLRYVPIT